MEENMTRKDKYVKKVARKNTKWSKKQERKMRESNKYSPLITFGIKISEMGLSTMK